MAPHPDEPPPNDAQSAHRLRRSTLLAALVAVTLLVTTVLPAEYGVDPTGVGRILGLTQMGLIKRSLAAEAEAEAAAAAKASPPDSIAPTWRNVPPVAVAPPDTTRHVTTVTLEPNQGKEIKLRMRKGARADYSWSTDHGVVNVDAHGDAVGRPSSYHGYKRGSNVGADQGTLVAAFDGNHGWFWRNRGTTPITITLVTQGTYEAVIPPR